MALSATGEGLTKSMEKHLDEIVNVLQKSMVDSVSEMSVSILLTVNYRNRR